MEPPRYAFATSEDAATVTAIDLDTRQSAATLPAGPAAHAMALTRDGARLYVVNRRGRSLTVVNARTPAVLDTIALSSDPMAAAASPDGRFLAVLGRDRLVAWVFEAATGTLLHEIPLAPSVTEPTATDPDGPPCSTHPVWAADSATFFAEDNPNCRLIRVDAEAGAPVAAVSLPSPAHMAYLAAGGGRLYALCTGTSSGDVPPSVAIIDTDAAVVVEDIPIPLAADESGELHHAAYDAAGGRLFVANMGRGRPRGGRSIHVLDMTTLRLTNRLEARAGAGHPLLSPDGEHLWVVNHSAPLVSVFDANRMALVGEVALPGARGMGHGCFFTADGASFWAVSNSAGVAYAIDTETLNVVGQISVGPNSQDIAHDWRDASA